MLNQTTLVPVTNISDGPVVYSVPELSIRREFQRGETKPNVTVKELRALFYMPGGETLIRDYLSVKNEELLAELGIYPEEEYYWTEAEIRDLLLNGSLARLQDCLDYAPKGIVNLVRDLAVTLKINDLAKRQAIYEATGLNITKAIEINEASAAGTETPVRAPRQRRVPSAPKSTTTN